MVKVVSFDTIKVLAMDPPIDKRTTEAASARPARARPDLELFGSSASRLQKQKQTNPTTFFTNNADPRALAVPAISRGQSQVLHPWR